MENINILNNNKFYFSILDLKIQSVVICLQKSFIEGARGAGVWYMKVNVFT